VLVFVVASLFFRSALVGLIAITPIVLAPDGYRDSRVWSTSWHRKTWIKAENLTAECAEGAERSCSARSAISAVRKVISWLHKKRP